jgi:hypothetical protein
MTATTESRADMTRWSRHPEDGPKIRVRALARRLVIAGLSILLPVLVIGCDDDPGHDPPDASPDPSVDASVPDGRPVLDATPQDASSSDAQPADGAPSDGPGDGEPPRVLASTPMPGAEGVATATEIQVTFDEDIEASTVHPASFIVVDDRQNPVLGALVVEGALVTFRPAIELTFRERYTVTITTEVTDLDGTPLAEEWSGSFTVRDGVFTDSTFLDLGAPGSLSRPAVAVGDRGHGFGVWASASEARATHFAPPEGWPDMAVGVPSAGSPRAIDVAAGLDDTALAVWLDDDGVRATHYSPPMGWHREPVRLADRGSEPQVAMDARGDGLAAWLQRDDTRLGVFASRFQGTGWSAASRVDSASGDAESLQLAVDHAGQGVAVWAQGGDIWSAAFRDGDWQPAALLEKAAGAAHQPRLVLDGDGRGMAFWIQHDGAQYRLCWSRLEPHGAWTEPVFADGGPAVGGSGQWLTWFAFNSLGQAVALWDERPDDCDPESPRPDPCARVNAQRFDVHSGWQAAETVSPDHYENIVVSRVAGIDRHGSIFAAWTHAAPEIGLPGAWLRRYTPEQGWSEPQSLIDHADGFFAELAIAVSPQGRMFLVWLESRDSDQMAGKAFY